MAFKLNTDGTVDETTVNKRQAQDVRDEIRQINEMIDELAKQKVQFLARKAELKAIIDQII